MERYEIMEAMTELKLYGMRAGFDEITGKGLARRDDIYLLIASLIRADHAHRHARSPDPSMRYHRDRQRLLALQKPQLTPGPAGKRT